MGACSLFEGISSHAPTMTQPTMQARAAAAIEKGLSCPLPSIQFPAVVAAGKVLQQCGWGWQEEAFQKVRTAAVAALCFQQGKPRPSTLLCEI